jgi:hypothetical protein
MLRRIVGIMRTSMILCFVELASRYIRVMKTNLMHYLSPVYLSINFYMFQANRQSTKKDNTYQLLYIYNIPPDDGLQICLKHVEVDWRNRLRINSASSWFSLHELPWFELPFKSFRLINRRRWDGGGCATFGGEGKCIEGYRGGEFKERNNLQDIGVDRRIWNGS